MGEAGSLLLLHPKDSNSALAAPLTWDLLWTVFHIGPVCSSAMNLFSVTVGTIR